MPKYKTKFAPSVFHTGSVQVCKFEDEAHRETQCASLDALYHSQNYSVIVKAYGKTHTLSKVFASSASYVL